MDARPVAVRILEMDLYTWHTAHADVENTIQTPISTAPHWQTMHVIVAICCLLVSCMWVQTTKLAFAEDDIIAFGVVSEIPKDLTRISVRIAIESSTTDLKLLASDQILSNPIWNKLEICHAMKLEGRPTAEGFYVASVRMIDSAMLPMVLQGFAGDCLLKKALEVAPFVD